MKDSILNLVFQRIAEGYEEQVPYYEKMLKLAQGQSTLLAKGKVKEGVEAEGAEVEGVEVEQLIALINQRQELISTLENMNKGISSLKKEIKETLEIDEFNLRLIKEKISGPGVEALSNVLDKLAQLLTQIKELDGKNEEALRRAIQQTQENLKSLQAVKKVNKAYQAEPSADGGVFIDYSK